MSALAAAVHDLEAATELAEESNSSSLAEVNEALAGLIGAARRVLANWDNC
jgi:hypothetical protein